MSDPGNRTAPLRSSAKGVELLLHVVPGSRKSELCGFHDGRLKVKLAAPPVDGKANKGLLAFISELFGVPQAAIEIIRGTGSRKKLLLIQGISVEDASRRLDAVLKSD